MILDGTVTFCDDITSSTIFCSLDSTWTVSEGRVEQDGCGDSTACVGNGSGVESDGEGGSSWECSMSSSNVRTLWLSHSECALLSKGREMSDCSSVSTEEGKLTSLWLSGSISARCTASLTRSSLTDWITRPRCFFRDSIQVLLFPYIWAVIQMPSRGLVCIPLIVFPNYWSMRT